MKNKLTILTILILAISGITANAFGANFAARETCSKIKSTLQKNLQTVNRIRFKTGASSAMVRGTIKNGREIIYVVNARAGQLMDVKITDGGANNDVVFHIVAPNNSLPMGADYDSEWRGKLSKTGDYKIVVGVIESENVEFKMSVAIRDENSSKSAAPKKLAEFAYQKMKHAVYLLADLDEDEENIEFVQIAQKLHDGEPDTNLILVDDDSGLKQYVAFMKEVEQLGGGAARKNKFPKAWAEEHILGNVGAEGENQSRRWYLMLGYVHEKIAELK